MGKRYSFTFTIVIYSDCMFLMKVNQDSIATFKESLNTYFCNYQ